MDSKRLISIVLLCFVAVCIISVFAQPAYAQDDMMEKKGIGGLFQGKSVDEDDPRLPNKYQKWAGWGSILVMIIVVKYL